MGKPVMTADLAFLLGMEAGFYGSDATPRLREARTTFPADVARGFETGFEMRVSAHGVRVVPADEANALVEAFR